MRIATHFVHEQRLSLIMDGQSRLEDAQQALSSGKRIRTASDAPQDAADLLRLRSEAAAMQRRQDGFNAALPVMKNTESALGDMNSLLSQIKVQGLQANNGSTGPEAAATMADNIRHLRDQLLEVANTHSGGQSLFAGTRTDAKPFTGSPTSYAGNDTALQVEVAAGTQFGVSVPGSAVLNPRAGTDLFANLETLESAVRQGDTGGITNALSTLEADVTNLTRLRGDIGSRIQYVQAVQDRTQDGLLQVKERAAGLENVDFAEAVLNEQAAETAQQATLAAAAKLDGPSLLNYLG